jgi:hypothetical protein
MAAQIPNKGLGLEAEQRLAQLFGGAVEHPVQLLGRDPGLEGAAAGHPQDPDHLDLAFAGLGRGGGDPGQGGPGGGLGVDRVGLALSPSGAAVGAVDLDDLEAVGAGEAGQAGPVGAGAFHPDAFHRPVAFGPGDQGDIAAGRGRKALGAAQPPGLVDHGGHMQLQVGVDPTVTGLSGAGMLSMPFLPGYSDRTARTHRDGGQHCDESADTGS